jgi:Domain of unknown function (DUF4157)
MDTHAQKQKKINSAERQPAAVNDSFRSQHPFGTSLANMNDTQPPDILPGFEKDFSVAPRSGHHFADVRVHAAVPETIQTKLMINQPGDVYEQEAERVAERVMQIEAPASSETSSTSQIARLDADDLLTRKEASETSVHETASVPPHVDEVLSSGGGQSLDESTRSFMEPRFRHDFSRVRVHTDERAAESARVVNALAFTTGQDVVFGKGQYVPGTNEGKKLLAHELTHVVQQGYGGQTTPLVQRQVAIKEAKSYETGSSLEGIVNDNVEVQKEILFQLGGALQDFGNVAESPSAKESEPKSFGTIVFDVVTQIVMEKLIDKAVDEIPGGKTLAKLGQSILEKVAQEKERAEKAALEHTLKDFNVDLRRVIMNEHRYLVSSHRQVITDTLADYNKLDKDGQQKLRSHLDIVNLDLHQFLEQQGTPQSLFQMIVEHWVERTPKKEGELAKVVIILDNDWNVKSAHIHALYGQRLAEQLKLDDGGKVNLDTLKVRRIVRFMPEEGFLPAAEVVLDAEGNYVEGPRAYTSIPGARQYVTIFAENLQRRGLPETDKLTGD